ncbi:hypothetical protein GmHk_10G028735 [Glycine max]|nr:hypothetical protein GmHk_10G028735 [Glycine max]
MQSQIQSQMQSQGLALPPNPLVGPSGPRVSTKGSCVDPSGNDPETGDSDRCGLYIEADPARLVGMGRVYEGSTVLHNPPLLPGQVKVSVEEVTDADAPVPVPTDEVSLVGQALHTFLAWSTHLVKSLSQQVAVSPAKPPPKPDPEVDDPLYLMTLTIPELFLRPYQVRWNATVFGVFNPDFPLYIKHEDLSEIAHGGQCLSISVLVILPKEHLVVWFCSLPNRPDNYLKGIINSALKGLDDAPQPKSKAPARWIVVKCGYYVMHWMSTIILGTFRNNWEAYFNDPRPLESERLKALWIQWAQFYLQRTRKASRLRLLSTRPPGAERPVVHVDPATEKADDPHRKKLRTYLGIVARDKVDITYENWKEAPTAQKDLIWEDIQAEFDIPEASDTDQDSVEDTVCDKYGISKEKWAQFCQTRRDPSWEDVRMKAQAIQKQNIAPHVLSRGGYDYLKQKLLAEKTKKKMQEAAQSGSVDGVIDPPSPVRRHVKWKMARTKKTGEMTTESAKEITEKIDSFEEQATQGSFVPHGRQDVLAAAIGRLEHPGRIRVARAGVTIKQYFGSAPQTSRSASSLPPDELQQLTQQIRDQLEESIIEKVTRQVMASFSQL